MQPLLGLQEYGVRRAIGLTCLGAFVCTPALGETLPPDDRIVVTGSRVQQLDDLIPQPLLVIPAAMFEKRGDIGLVDTLTQYPALLSSASGSRTAGSNAAFGMTGAALLNLRGLGFSRTLVLVDGRRYVSSFSGTTTVDIGTLPSQLIEAVDVLTSGTSAVYGSDGVSGVVNFRLRRDFQGLRLVGQNGISSRGDAGERLGSVTYGMPLGDDRGNFTVAYEYRAQDRVRARDRARVGDPIQSSLIVRNPADVPDDASVPDRIALNDLRYADSSVEGALDIDRDGAADFTGSGREYARGMILPASGGLTQGGDGTPVAGYEGDLQARFVSSNANLLAHYEVSSTASVFLEASYARARTFSQNQPSFDIGTVLSAENPYLQDLLSAQGLASSSALLSRDNFDLGVRGERDRRTTARIVAGSTGQLLPTLRYDLSYTFGQTRSRTVLTDFRISDRYFAALDAIVDPVSGAVVCRSDLFPANIIDPSNFNRPAATFSPGPASGCKPLNLLGNGVTDPAAVAWIRSDPVSKARLRQHVATALLTGELGRSLTPSKSPASFALGVEYRRESSRFSPGDALSSGELADYAVLLPEKGSFSVRELFGEVRVPVLQQARLGYELSITAAARASRYSTIGTAKTWNIGALYRPVRAVGLRASLSRSVRAPNITELFGPRNGAYALIADPCDPAFIKEGSENRADNCAALLTGLGLNEVQRASFNPQNEQEAVFALPGVTSGNPALRAEIGRTWTAGIDLQPTRLPGMRLSASWYDIAIRRAINTPTAEEVAQLCVDQQDLANVYCGDITRSAQTGFITGWAVKPQNVATFATSGADLSLGYKTNFSSDQAIDFSVTGGYLHKLHFVALPGAALDHDRGEPYAPKWSAVATLAWQRGDLMINYGLSWFSKTRRFRREELAANPDLTNPDYFWYKPKWEHGLHASYNCAAGIQLRFGVRNIFDQQPALASRNYPVEFTGRSFYAGARAGW